LETAFLATAAENIAAGLERLTAPDSEAGAAAPVLHEVRALRDVAGVDENPPLVEVLEVLNDAGSSLERSHGRAAISPEARQLFETAARYLRTQAAALRESGDQNALRTAHDSFATAHAAWSAAAGESDRDGVVPISQLFFADGASGVVETSPNPPTSADARFRLELVRLGEQLGEVVEEARASVAAGTNARSSRDIRRLLRELETAARSFGEPEIAEFVASHYEAVKKLDALGLASLADLAGVAAEPGANGERLRDRLSELARGRELSAAIAAAFGQNDLDRQPTAAEPPETPIPSQTNPDESPEGVQAPSSDPDAAEGESAAKLIDSSIATLETLKGSAFAEAVSIPEDTVVPIESLLYRGRAALDRAVEIRDTLRGQDIATIRDSHALEELFELLDLARAE
jgi:hypothetical protein